MAQINNEVNTERIIKKKPRSNDFKTPAEIPVKLTLVSDTNIAKKEKKKGNTHTELPTGYRKAIIKRIILTGKGYMRTDRIAMTNQILTHSIKYGRYFSPSDRERKRANSQNFKWRSDGQKVPSTWL